MTGYQLFVIQVRDSLTGNSPQVSKQLLELWKAMPQEENSEYEKIAQSLSDEEIEQALRDVTDARNRGDRDPNQSEYGDWDSDQEYEESIESDS